MSHDSYYVRVEVLENAFSVEVPDMEARAKHAKKSKNGDAAPYYDECKKYAAKSVKEVLRLVKESLEKIPAAEFDSAFDDAASKKD